MRSAGESAPGGDPGAASLAANKFFRLFISRARTGRPHLLEVAQRLDEFLDHSEVRAQPPEQQNQQQGNQGDNYQVLQITFSAISSRIANAATKRKQLPLAITIGFASSGSSYRQIILPSTRKRIYITTAGRRRVNAPIDTSRGQRASMNCFGENSGNLLRKGAMLGRRSTTERLFQFIGDISADEHSFTIDHLFSGAPCENQFNS